MTIDRDAAPSLRLQGELTLAHAREQLTAGQCFLVDAGAQGARTITFDLGGITRTDTAALALACHWLREAASRGLALHWANLPPGIPALAQACDVAEIFSPAAEERPA